MNGHRFSLRRDLASMSIDGSPRSIRVVVDDIAGRIARVPNDLWQALQSGNASEPQWRQAVAAGWTRQRSVTHGEKFSLLAFRVTLGSIDTVARYLAPISGVVFSRTAFFVWALTALVTLLMMIERWSQVASSTASMQAFFVQASPVALVGWFVVTKVIHELAHAVMCRRVGSRCGPVGILFLCGMPCPFCDVSDVVRNPSRWSRAAVMLAGIYVEWIVATIAAIVWINANHPATQLHAMNLMIVCGISTLLFNANPLMRYDGYFVLSDLINSFHLRSEAGDAFDHTVMSKLAGTGYRHATSNRSVALRIGLSCYHVASVVYRVLITITIAAFLITMAEQFHLRSLMIIIVVIAVSIGVAKIVRRMIRAIRGGTSGAGNAWTGVPVWRRGSLSFAAVGFAATVVFVPMPRYRSSVGVVDAAAATKVFLPQTAVIESVTADFGDRVRMDQTIVRVRDDAAAVDQAKLHGQLRLAQVRSEWSRRETANRGDFAQTWATHHAVESALQSQLVSVRRRVDLASVRSPVDGILLPSEPVVSASPLAPVATLLDRAGTLGSIDQPWCRISPDGRIHAVFHLDANDRQTVTTGSPVRIVVPAIVVSAIGDQVIETVVESVSPIIQDNANVLRRAGYKVVCELPPVNVDAMLTIVGTPCHGVVKLPWRSIAQDGWDWLEDWIRE